MPNFPDDPASRFLDYYGRYLIAKRQKQSEMIWRCAVACRVELRKMGDPAKEAQFCGAIFEGFVSQEKATLVPTLSRPVSDYDDRIVPCYPAYALPAFSRDQTKNLFVSSQRFEHKIRTSPVCHRSATTALIVFCLYKHDS